MKTARILERQGGILYDDGRVEYFFSATSHSGIAFPAKVIGRERGIGRLTTYGIITCAGVAYQNKTNSVLVHAFNPENLRELLKVVNERSYKHSSLIPERVFIYSPVAEVYLNHLRSIFKSSEIVVQHRKYKKPMDASVRCKI